MTAPRSARKNEKVSRGKLSGELLVAEIAPQPAPRVVSDELTRPVPAADRCRTP